MKTFLTALLFLLVGTRAFALEGFTGKVLGVRSSDAIVVQSERGQNTISLHGIDWSHTDTQLQNHTRDYLRRRLGTGAVKIAIRSKGPDGLLFADVFLVQNGRILPEPLSVELARKGLAKWSRGYAAGRNDIRAAESNAKATERGLWSDSTGANVALPAPRALNRQTVPLAPVRINRVSTPAPEPESPLKGNPVLRAITAIGWPLGGILLALSGWMALPVLQLRQISRVPISSLHPGLVRVKGVVVPMEQPLTTPTGEAPALMYREEAWRFIDGKWNLVRDESETISFLIDDGTGQVRVEGKISDFQTSAPITRFYNGVHVPQWSGQPYENDERAQVLYLAPHTHVTVLASAVPNGSGGYRLIRPTIAQGNVKKASNLRARLAAGTFLLALAIFAAAVLALSFIAVEGLPPINHSSGV